ncbi:chemotaxis protein CheA [Timonella senegalensis]|uniref:chemotaxis protein CheA n=1 Tax=Timonella senegalensis TaxID=1465825 RepID=UPI0028A89669|nr:chemotaxis protein CheA [Timonella senegalensis]
MDGVDEIIREFLIESNENLDQLDSDLIALESEPGSRELLGSIFRTIHTVKGTSGFLALDNLERVAHVGENLLVELRDGKRQMDPATTDVLLLMVDTIRALLRQIDETGEEQGVDISSTVAALQSVLDNEPLVQGSDGSSPTTPLTPSTEHEPLGSGHAEVIPEQDAAGQPISESGACAEESQSGIVVRENLATPATAAARVEGPSTSAHRHSSDTSIRVDVSLLDELMRQVGELVLVRNQIAQLAGFESGDLLRSSQRLSLIASELQDGVMKTRMQPIEQLWSKMPRVVRDLSATCGREVRLEMLGGDTELDRSLLEAVKDPLTHLIRNAVDHGIEAPDDRLRAGKTSAGLLRLSAYHAGGQVVVEVSDDGIGLDPVKIAAKSIERGLKTREQLATMTDTEIQSLVFLAGFSTASTVSNISGRGVGMDVVRSNIEEIGGTVEVDSRSGQGTTWRLRIPLTLAIMPALTVTSGHEIYAIPQVNLLELVAIDSSRTDDSIELIGGREVYRLRGSLLPLVRLADVLATESHVGDTVVIAVLQTENQRFGLIVDKVLNNEEIVVKPLSTILKGIGIFAGATLMGDGQVALILDAPTLARRELSADSMEALAAKRVEAPEDTTSSAEFLVVGVGAHQRRRIAIPLSAVTRLEHIQLARIEMVGGREVVQYRGDVVPVQRLGRVLGADSVESVTEKPTVVFTRGDRSVAMIVDEILEILDDRGAIRSDVTDSGLLGSIVLNGEVTELLDTVHALELVDPLYFSNHDPDADLSSFDNALLAGI